MHELAVVVVAPIRVDTASPPALEVVVVVVVVVAVVFFHLLDWNKMQEACNRSVVVTNRNRIVAIAGAVEVAGAARVKRNPSKGSNNNPISIFSPNFPSRLSRIPPTTAFLLPFLYLFLSPSVVTSFLSLSASSSSIFTVLVYKKGGRRSMCLGGFSNSCHDKFSAPRKQINRTNN